MSQNITLTDGQNATVVEWDAAFMTLYTPLKWDLQLWWDLGDVLSLGFSIFFAVVFAIFFLLHSISSAYTAHGATLDLWP
jgi:hypothetical protein